MTNERDYDIIIVGGGAAGLSAAVEAALAGQSVLVLEAAPRVGGSSALSAGVIYAGATEVQREAGIEDSVDAMIAYGTTLAQNRLDGSLARRMCEDSAAPISWLRSLGVVFDPARTYHGGVEPAGLKRSHRVDGGGERLIEILEGVASTHGVDIVCNTRVKQLYVDEYGQVAGIKIDGDVVRSAAVVLASGGFGENLELVQKYYPSYVEAAGDWHWHIGNKHSLGDGLAIGQAAGARIANADRGLISITHRFDKDNELFHPDWLVFVNEEGRRFMREFENYGMSAQNVMDQTGRHCFAIFDENARRAAKQRPEWVGLVKMHWTESVIPDLVDAGKIAKADTIEELAERLGIDAKVLTRTIEIYNRDCEAGADSYYGKAKEGLLPIMTPPFYGAEMRPATIAATFTGLAIDRDAAALDHADRPIPGLFAAGETTNAMGSIYWGGGFALATSMIFGRRAGQSAARHAMRNTQAETTLS